MAGGSGGGRWTGCYAIQIIRVPAHRDVFRNTCPAMFSRPREACARSAAQVTPHLEDAHHPDEAQPRAQVRLGKVQVAEDDGNEVDDRPVPQQVLQQVLAAGQACGARITGGKSAKLEVACKQQLGC